MWVVDVLTVAFGLNLPTNPELSEGRAPVPKLQNPHTSTPQGLLPDVTFAIGGAQYKGVSS